MSKNLFICHRPYHIMFSYFYSKQYFNSDDCDCLIFNVLDINRKEYSNFFDDIFDYSKMFRRTYYFDRSKDVRFYDIYKFNSYYKHVSNYIFQYIKDMDAYDNIYFFSDKEFTIEIFVRMLKLCTSPKKVYLIDEGIVSKKKCNKVLAFIKSTIKYAIIKAFQYEFLGYHVVYGMSDFYDTFLTSSPDTIMNISKERIQKIDNIKFYSSSVIKLGEVFSSKKQSVIYISSALSEANFMSINEELNILRRIIQVYEKCRIDFYIKPHPVESDNKFSGIIKKENILSKYIPVELYIDYFGFICTSCSSAVFNIDRDRCIIILAKIFGIKEDKYNMFASLVNTKIVENIEELEKNILLEVEI